LEIWLGKVIRQENITLNRKSYMAWYIEYEYKTNDDFEYYFNKYWFVPYIGIVKVEEIGEENGIVTYELKASPISTKYEPFSLPELLK